MDSDPFDVEQLLPQFAKLLFDLRSRRHVRLLFFGLTVRTILDLL